MTKNMTISINWHVDDVLEVRPDLSRKQAWEILCCCKEHHNAEVGINWIVLELTAQLLFGDAVDSD